MFFASKPAVLKTTSAIFLMAGLLLCDAKAQQSAQNMQIATDILNSPAIEQLQQQAATSNARIVGEIDTPTTGAAPAKVTQPNQSEAQRYVDRLRNGKHVTVSAEGENAIALIRETLEPKTRPDALKKLKDLADNDTPEALNFFGFIREYGIYQFPKNTNLAQSFYSKAAKMGYQPALYNIGKNQFYANDENALQTLQQAADISTSEVSSRVCGLASYVAMRAKRLDLAVSYASKCNSPLAGFGKAQAEPNIEVKIEFLRRTLTTGASEGYTWLQSITNELKPDPQLFRCKYALIAKYRLRNSNWQNIEADAASCLKSSAAEVSYAPIVAGFVKTEIVAIQKLKDANKFHFSWSVPFLPFTQNDVDLFIPFIK